MITDALLLPIMHLCCAYLVVLDALSYVNQKEALQLETILVERFFNHLALCVSCR